MQIRPPLATEPPRAGRLTPFLKKSPLRDAVTALTRTPEPTLLSGLVAQATLTPEQSATSHALALRIARGVRERSRAGGRAGLVQGLLQEFALSSQEGVALMCLAEALLRIPDMATRDALIRDKIADGDWQRHLGQSPSLFVNAASWGLLLTGKLVSTHSDTGLTATLKRAVARGGEPLIRKGVDMAMRMMGEQFVAGETIGQALDLARPKEAIGFRYSYDMLGEAAATAADAERYLKAYEDAIHAIGQASAGRGIIDGPGISIKLSALHPRYVRAKHKRVQEELYPRVKQLALLARRYDIGLNIDAEESDRLELSLDLLERLCFEPALSGWNGIGFVIQAYQKRCPAVVDVLVDLARRSGHRLMIRLVKGAYWDSEIKRAQVDGQDGYPVYTRKAYTDVAYVACARKLLAAPDAAFPQFATHNAQTLAAIHTLAGPDFDASRYEFQCLHGMGEPLYEQLVGHGGPTDDRRPCRIYAPVGTHETLLAYLVRRLLENGANTSFVNRVADESIDIERLIEDPVATVRAMAEQDGELGAPHPAIPSPSQLFGDRINSRGQDLADEHTLALLDEAFEADAGQVWQAEPLLAVGEPGGQWQPVLNPADDGDEVGHVRDATLADVAVAVSASIDAFAAWSATPPAGRADVLERAADRLEADTLALVPLLVREAGKSCANAVSEVREAVDFLRYYAQQVRRDFLNDTHVPLGPVACISPWNFPLSIFVGQVAAALAAGNVVLAKPAEQTPLIAAAASRLMHGAGVPRGALQLLPGPGETIGAALVADLRVNGVLFTGSTDVARLLQRSLAERLTERGQVVPLIAETGGQNAMVVDSSALVEQAVADIVASAFDSAGQRCSALRLLCVQDDAADRLVEMLKGATQELKMADTRALSSDVGPAIDAQAQAMLETHVQMMASRGRPVWRLEVDDADDAEDTEPSRGCFVAPTIIELDSIKDLEREVFGPVLHVLRYERAGLADLLDAINATGYGLTHGVHTRIDETVAQVVTAAHAGNVYVNRTVVGAVVGVQPFGGEGLSGTGPKAGGPLYLLRLLAQRPAGAAKAAIAASGEPGRVPVRGLEPLPGGARASDLRSAGGQAPDADSRRWPAPDETLAILGTWAGAHGMAALAGLCESLGGASPLTSWIALSGPTGEANLYSTRPREAVLCLASSVAAGDVERDLLGSLAAVLAVGSQAVWASDSHTLALSMRLPAVIREHIVIADDWTGESVRFDAAVCHAGRAELVSVARRLAQRPGPIVTLTGLSPGDLRVPLERLVIERSLSINTAAAGGNASLMTIG